MTGNIFGIQGLYATEEQEEQARVHQQYFYNKGVVPEQRVKTLRTQSEIYEHQGVTLPVEAIEPEVGVYEQTIKDLSRMTQDFGKNRVTRRTLTDLMSAPVFYDDEENMKETEGWFKDLSDSYKIGKLNVSMAELGLKIDLGQGTQEDYKTLETLEREQRLLSKEEFQGNFFTEMPAAMAEMLPLLNRAIQKSGKYGAVGAAAGSAVPIVGTVTGGITSLSAGTLFEFGRLEAGLSYVEMMKMRDANGKPYSPYVMGGAAGVIGLINGAIEFGSGGALAKIATKPVKDLVKRSVLKTLTTRTGLTTMGRVGGLMAGGMAVNGGEEALQEAVGITVKELLKEYGGTPHMGFGEALQQIGAAGYTGAQAGMGFGLLPAAPFVATEMANIQKANKNQELAAFLSGIADESKVMERMPERQREFVKEVVKEHGAASHVGVDVESLDTFFQTVGVNEQQVEATWPEVAKSMKEARETGSEVQIPVEVFMQDFVKADGIEAIIGNVRMHPELNTDNENAALRESMQQVIQSLPEQDQVDTETYSYFKNVLAEVESPEVADFQAKLLASFFTTQAQNEGIEVKELLARHRINVDRTDLMQADMEAAIAEIQAGKVPTEGQIRGQSLQEFMAERSAQGMDQEQAATEAIEAGYFAEKDPELVSKEEITAALQSEQPVYAYGGMDPKLAERAERSNKLAREAEAAGVDLATGTPESLTKTLMSRRLEQAAGWAENRISKVVDEFDQKGMVAWVHPNDFIRATVGGPAGFDAIVEETTDLDPERVRSYEDVPTLWVDEETGEIVGHEGRHRMAALFASGVRRVPVVVNYRSRGDRSAQANLQLSGQQFETTSGTDIVATDAVPISWENRQQILEMMAEEGRVLFQEVDWATWEPEVTSTGKIKGAPQWVTDDKKLTQMREQITALAREGAVGRFWYEDSAKAILNVVGGNVREAEKLIQLIAIYSPQANVEVNTYFAISAWNQWKNGISSEDFKVKTEDQDNKARAVLYNDEQFEGRKTSSFYLNLTKWIYDNFPAQRDQLNLDEELEARMQEAATIDMWMYRAFGYENEAAGDDKGTGAYSFSENETRRLAATLGWEPWQAQAAIWTAMKARYEKPEVKAKTWERSIEEGFATLDEKGKPKLPTTAAGMRQHRRIWHEEAMKVSSEEATALAIEGNADFSTFVDKATMVITWEALPSEALGLEIFNASPEVQELFTREGKDLLLSPDGRDLLAEALGIHLGYVKPGAGGYAGNVTPNNLSHIIPTKQAGDFTSDHARAYARAIQYIFQQDAVPWFRADSRLLNTKKGRDEMLFRVVNAKTGRTVPKSKVDTLAEALAIAEQKGEGFEVRGGKYARGVTLTFDRDLTGQDRQEVLQYAMEVLGEDAGFTATAPNEITLINFRDDETGVPFMDDIEFMEKILEFDDAYGESLGINTDGLNHIFVEGEYGHVQDWQGDISGEAILDHPSIAGSPDLQAWIRDRRAAFEGVLERYSGEQLALREQEALQQDDLTTYFQGGADTRGYISIGPARDFFNITLTGKANLSTFLHESGHMFLEIMDQLSLDPNATPGIRSDMAVIKDWVGWEEGQTKFTTEQHEKFARGFEAYLMEGQAPSAELQSAFRRFAAWLNHIYRSIADLQVNLTDEVREVMDRMLASEEAIKHKQQIEQIMPVFTDAETAGMTAEEYQQYLKDFADSMEEAEETMRTRLLNEIRQRNTREYREAKKAITEQVTQDVMERPVYAAIEFLRTGLLRDSNDIPPGLDKLDIDTVRQMFPNDPQIVKQLPRSITKKNGANPDEVAMYFGYESGHRMLVEMLNVKTAKQTIKDEVDGQMYAIHGDTYNDPDALRSEATSALHNDRISDYLVRELRLLSRKGNLPVPPGFVRQAQLYADRMVESMAVAQLRSPHRFMRAEQREAKKALEAAAANNWEVAAEAKKNQIINHWLYRKTVAAREESDKIFRYMKNFQKPAKQAKLGKAGGSYFESAMIILEGLELRKVSQASLARRKSLAAYLESIDEEGQIVQMPVHLREESMLRNYSELSLQEFRGMHDALRNIDRLATLKNNLLRKRDLIDFNSAMERVQQLIYQNKKQLRVSKRQNPTAWENWKAKLRSWDASLLKTEFLLEQLDGGSIGLIHELIYEPMVEAHDAKHKLMNEVDKTLFKRLKNLPKAQRQRLASTYDFMGTTMQGHEVVAIALNMGNESNIDKLIRGYEDRGWSRDNVMDRLDEILTKQDWELVQFIWDEVDKFWPMIVELNKSHTGLEPPKVEAAEVTSRHGTFKGGYYPVIYDPARRPKSAKDAQKKAADMFENNFMRPNVDKGFTEERTSYAAPILLSLRGLGSHINEVAHYITHYDAVRQAYRVINDKRFAQAMYDTVGKEYYDQLIPWLQNVANSSVVSGQQDPLEKFFNHMAVGTSIMAMGGSLSTGFMQLLGLSSALARLGPRYLMSGMKQAMIPSARKFAYDNSREIPHMLKNFDRDGRAVMEEMVLNVVGGKKERLKYKHAQLVQFSFYMIGQLQQQVNIATFMGAYQQAVDNKGMSEKDAIKYADATMRMTQSSGAKKDLATMQRTSGYRKLFTAFYTYFSSLYGLLRSAGVEAFKGKWVQASGQFTALILLPTLIEQLVRPDPGDETTEEWWWRYAGNVGSYVVSPLPFWRDIATGLTNIATGGSFGYKFAPVGDMLSKGVVSVGRAIDPDKDLSWYDFKNIVRTTGMAFHLPVTQPLRWAEYMSAYLNGEVDEPFREFIFGVRK